MVKPKNFLRSPRRACAASMRYEARRCEAPGPGGIGEKFTRVFGSKSKTFLCYGCNMGKWKNMGITHIITNTSGIMNCLLVITVCLLWL